MKVKKILFLSGAVACSLCFTSCASYRASPLWNLSADVMEGMNKEENVSVVSKTFTRHECDTFLDRDVLSEGYQPIQIYIRNDSDKSYVFSLSRISLPVATPEEVADKVHTSTVGRAVGYGVGALFIWPLAIPAIVDGIGSAKANKALDSDFATKVARDQVIYPHSQFNAVIFVPVQAFQHSYTLTLVDQDSQQPKTFRLVS